MELGLQKFIQINNNATSRWKEFKTQNFPNIYEAPRVEELTPFFNSKYYSQLTLDEKSRLYSCYIQFNAEAIILLELVLHQSIKSLNQEHNNPVIQKATEKMQQEEKDHTQAYLRFLKSSCPGFPKESFLLRRNKNVKNLFVWIARKFPVALTLPGAKFEAYSVFYSHEISNHFKTSPNNWSQLNHLHMLDEKHHIGYEFDIHELTMEKYNFLKATLAFISTYVFVFFLQVLFIIGCYRMISYSLSNIGTLKKIIYSLRLGRWILRDFTPYRLTRDYLKKIFKSRKPRLGSLIALIYK